MTSALMAHALSLRARWTDLDAHFTPDITDDPALAGTVTLNFEFRNTSYQIDLQEDTHTLREWYWGNKKGVESDDPDSEPWLREAVLPAGLTPPQELRRRSA